MTLSTFYWGKVKKKIFGKNLIKSNIPFIIFKIELNGRVYRKMEKIL